MSNNIDINSKEFQNELKKTKDFVNKVRDKLSFLHSEDKELIEMIEEGLTRNKLLYSKRYCPCFIIIGKTKEERNKADNRVCPCKPALKVEIPKDGKCHCGIFCSKNGSSTSWLDLIDKGVII